MLPNCLVNNLHRFRTTQIQPHLVAIQPSTLILISQGFFLHRLRHLQVVDGESSKIPEAMISKAVFVPIQDNGRFSIHLTFYSLPYNLIDVSAHVYENPYTGCSCTHVFMNQANSRSKHNMSELLQRLTWMRWSRRWQNGQGRAESSMRDNVSK
jgi:hypothetical protein